MFDILRLATVHIQIISRVFRIMYQCELHALSSLWKLFRGKKRNILRHRTDTLENSYDSMQLLLGMILFTIFLFLFTTIFVYYVFFVVVVENCIVFGLVISSIWWLWLFIIRLPLGEAIVRWKSPGRFGNKVYFDTLDNDELLGWMKEMAITLCAPLCWGEVEKCDMETRRKREDEGNSIDRKESIRVARSKSKRTITRIRSSPEPIKMIVSRSFGENISSFLGNISSFVLEILSGAPCSAMDVCISISSSL
mmetsp:Transcript_44081/g.66434  ORF Transcript_44081/g.66434 Transcript_44081/m.66434 type:complete len:252 (+) Transcript_44081:120-875(+)